MISSKINLLPQDAIEALHKDEIKRERRYYILAIGLALIGGTIIMVLVTFFFNQSKVGTEELLSDQEEDLSRLNDLWNRVIILQEAVRSVPPMRDNDLQLHQAWRHVTANLRDLDLVSFAGAGKGAYKITAVGTSPEESTQFLIDVGNSITNATITLDSINQDSESVNFVFLLKFNE